MVFIINHEKILQYKSLEENFRNNIELSKLYEIRARRCKDSMLLLSTEILKEAGVI